MVIVSLTTDVCDSASARERVQNMGADIVWPKTSMSDTTMARLITEAFQNNHQRHQVSE